MNIFHKVVEKRNPYKF